ncbi:hypothetical protein ACFPH6_31125 [Streptomyces xiangluensis]|uniref:Uncharacterized protein n=1 Tax=Streptomyces xiangluensis TaxID=2665720 RepID=A0ABV8YUK2_9ACTN
MSWTSGDVGEDDLVTVYWFPDPYPSWRRPVFPTNGGGLSTGLDVTGTPDEIASWRAAATACVNEVAAAHAELRRVDLRTRRWRLRPMVRRWAPVVHRWAEEKYDEAKAPYLDRVRAAVSAYQPVLDAIDQRVSERAAAVVRARQEREQEEERRRHEAAAPFRAWERRQAVADRRLHGGLTPRQMAARGDNPESWPRSVQAAVGDLDAWWAGVRASVRNQQARAEAVRKVIGVITATAAALEEAGRPGIGASIGASGEPSHETLYGWWVRFTWSDLPDVERLKTPPDIPLGHLPSEGMWDFDLYLPDRVFFQRWWDGKYSFATASTKRMGGSSDHRLPVWLEASIEEFTEGLFPAWISYWPEDSYHWGDVRTPIVDHADPAVYVPYVHSVAEHAVAAFRGFQALMPPQK